MKIPNHMVEKLKELDELKKESNRLQKLAYPEVAKKYHANEIDSETLLWLALCQYQDYLEEKNQGYQTELEKAQKNNSCSNTSH